MACAAFKRAKEPRKLSFGSDHQQSLLLTLESKWCFFARPAFLWRTNAIKKCVSTSFLLALPTFCFGTSLETETSKDLEHKIVTLLFTNDLESTYDPVEAFWRDDIEQIGGIAELATLIDKKRKSEPNVFLFDAGDIFTGVLAKRKEKFLSSS